MGESAVGRGTLWAGRVASAVPGIHDRPEWALQTGWRFADGEGLGRVRLPAERVGSNRIHGDLMGTPLRHSANLSSGRRAGDRLPRRRRCHPCPISQATRFAPALLGAVAGQSPFLHEPRLRALLPFPTTPERCRARSSEVRQPDGPGIPGSSTAADPCAAAGTRPRRVHSPGRGAIGIGTYDRKVGVQCNRREPGGCACARGTGGPSWCI